MKELRGCNAIPEAPIVFDDEELTRCPRRPLLDNGTILSKTFFLYRNYDRGILPEEGALLSQPHKLLRMFATIDDAKNAATGEQMKRDEAQRARQSRLQSMMKSS